MKKFITAATAACLASAAMAQVTINSGTASLTLNAISGVANRTGTGAGLGDFKSLGTTDHMFQNWWWYHVNGGAREFALSTLTSQRVGSDAAEFVYDEPEGLRFYVCVAIDQFAGSGGAAYSWGVHVENRNTFPMEVSLFDYCDYDMNASSGGDSAVGTFALPNMVQEITDVNVGRFGCLGADAYQTGAFSTVRTLLTNATIDGMGNTGLPFGPGDWTSAYQWNFGLPAGQGRHFNGLNSVDAPLFLHRFHIVPDAFNVVSGSHFGGNLGSLANSDDDKFVALNDENDPNMNVNVHGISPCTKTGALGSTVEISSSRNDIGIFVDWFNYRTNAFAPKGFAISTFGDNNINSSDVTAPSEFIDETNRDVRLRVIGIPSVDIDAGDGWTESIDQVHWVAGI